MNKFNTLIENVLLEATKPKDILDFFKKNYKGYPSMWVKELQNDSPYDAEELAKILDELYIDIDGSLDSDELDKAIIDAVKSKKPGDKFLEDLAELI